MFCVSYATPPPTIHEHQEEEIYSSLKKVKRNPIDLTTQQMTEKQQQHITMIPLGSPHELRREPTHNGTVIRVASKSTDQPLGELIPKMRNNNTIFGSINNLSSKPSTNTVVKKDFESWSGRVMEGRIQTNGHNPHHRSTTNNMRGYWENNIQHERQMRAEEEKRNRPKSYGFPKWRSTDALSASLVASNSIQIPKDSRIPEERLRKMEETEREAIEVKREIQEEADVGRRKPLSKGKSLDSLYIMENAATTATKPWYDAEQIKAAVSRESIANIATSRDFFENASNRDWSASRSRLSSLSVAPPLPPKSEAIQLRQSIYQPDMSSPQTIDPIEQQEVLLMLYLKQNLDIAQGLGIRIPPELMAEMEDLQMLPVELRICDEEPHRMFSPGMKNGRYQRKIQPQISAHSSRPSIGQKYINKKQDHFQSNLDLSSNSTYSHHNNYGSSYAH